MKKNEELQLNQALSEMRLEVKAKELQIKELERDQQLLVKELQSDLKRVQQLLKAKDNEIKAITTQKE